MTWWALSGLIHIIHEGYWVFSPEFYKDKSGNYFAEVCKLFTMRIFTLKLINCK